MKSYTQTKLILLAAGLMILSACSKTKVVIDGERESVIFFSQKLKASPELEGSHPQLPVAKANKEWTQQFGESDAALLPLQYPAHGKIKWSRSVAEGSSSYNRLLSRPIFVADKFFVYDAVGNIYAYELATQKRLWKVSTTPKGAASAQALGGGICYGEGTLFAATGFGEVIALDPANGKTKWSTTSNSPLRIAPVYHKGQLFTINIENQLDVRQASDGGLIWSHTGITESAGVLGGAGPAISGDTVIVPYGSGEIYALNTRTGQVLWQENIATGLTSSSLGTIAHIHAQPIIDQKTVFVMSHSGIMTALDFNSGKKLWSVEVGGIQTPAAAAGNVFALTDSSQIVNFTMRDGKIRWATDIPAYKDEKNKRDKLFWSGPILGDGHLYCVGSHNVLLQIDVKNGKITKEMKLPYPAKLAPQIVDQVLYVLCDNGTLVAID